MRRKNAAATRSLAALTLGAAGWLLTGAGSPALAEEPPMVEGSPNPETAPKLGAGTWRSEIVQYESLYYGLNIAAGKPFTITVHVANPGQGDERELSVFLGTAEAGCSTWEQSQHGESVSVTFSAPEDEHCVFDPLYDPGLKASDPDGDGICQCLVEIALLDDAWFEPDPPPRTHDPVPEPVEITLDGEGIADAGAPSPPADGNRPEDPANPPDGLGQPVDDLVQGVDDLPAALYTRADAGEPGPLPPASVLMAAAGVLVTGAGLLHARSRGPAREA